MASSYDHQPLFSVIFEYPEDEDEDSFLNGGVFSIKRPYAAGSPRRINWKICMSIIETLYSHYLISFNTNNV